MVVVLFGVFGRPSCDSHTYYDGRRLINLGLGRKSVVNTCQLISLAAPRRLSRTNGTLGSVCDGGGGLSGSLSHSLVSKGAWE